MPALTETFTIDVTGESGEKYPGVFKAKPRLTPRDVLLQDQYRRELLGPKSDQPISPDARILSDVFSKIWVHLVDAPLWWKEKGNGIDIVDQEPAGAVYKEILRIEQEAVDKVVKKGEEAAAVLRPAEPAPAKAP